jgi:hypothetical protein
MAADHHGREDCVGADDGKDLRFRLELSSDVAEVGRAAFVALTHAAWLRYLTHLEGAELRAEVLRLPPPNREWQRQAAHDAFAIIGAALPAGDPFRAALARYAAEAIPKLLEGCAPPAPSLSLFH